MIKRIISAVMSVMLVTLMLATTALATTFNYTDFSSTAGLTLVGNASQVGTKLRLVPAISSQRGAAWTASKQSVQFGFDTTFTFQITNQFSGGADGLAFVIQNEDANAIGGYGGGMGYHNMPNSLAVEFDTWYNGGYDEPNGNHISVRSQGTAPNSAIGTYSLGTQAAGLPIFSADGAVHTARIVYTPGTMDVYLDGVLRLSVSVDLATLLSLDNGTAYVGFTAATGAAGENEDILSWSFSGNNPPTADAGGPYSGDEGSTISLSGANAFDPDGDPLTYNWAIDSALCSFNDATLLNPDVICSDNGNFTATLTVQEQNGLAMKMYDINSIDPNVLTNAVGNGFAGLTPGTFSVTTAGGTISTDKYTIPVVNFPDTVFDISAFYNVGVNGYIDGGSTPIAPQGDDISIQPPGGNDIFGASFTGYLYLPTGGNVTFTVGIDDAFSLELNGTTVMQFLGLTNFAYYSGTATGLPAGFVPITLNYGEYGGEADVVLLSAAGGGLPGGVIPQQYLFVNPHLPIVKTASVNVNNVDPSVGAISVDQTLVPVNTTVNASASFTDPGTNDTHTASWNWGDGSSAGTVTQGAGSGSVADSHTYTAPGVYPVELTVTDDDGGVGTALFQYIVVYDPSAGFVTGGGWIDSPAGAYKNDETLSGKATFGFVSKYKKGATVPTGNTQFQFHTAGFNFHSSSYEWLVVNQNGQNAQFRGEGTVNGALDSNGNAYKFMIWAGDGSPDTFRIRIWSELDGVETVVYDNGVEQELGGGSIVIHTKK